MNTLSNLGRLAIGSKLRQVASKVTEDASKIYQTYEVEIAPKWFPVYYVLSQNGPMTITAIAQEIGHTQPSVSKIIREMSGAGLVRENKSREDKRKNVVSLTDKGKAFSEKIEYQFQDVDLALEKMMSEATHHLYEALVEWEYLLDQQSLYRRVLEQKKKRESKYVSIVPYEERYHHAFKDLNVAWISRYFEMEEADYRALEHPQPYILDGGGKILVALIHGEPVGVCALIKMDDPTYDFELAKMAVSPHAQGKGVGFQLGMAIIELAKTLGASSIYLESNTILEPAIQLYHKLGFKKIVGHSTPYKRCNIQMALSLT